MLLGFALAVVTYFPLFQGITQFANPKLEQALAAAPVTVTADPAKCSFQFKATGTEKFRNLRRDSQACRCRFEPRSIFRSSSAGLRLSSVRSTK
jgi:hypothetical protein